MLFSNSACLNKKVVSELEQELSINAFGSVKWLDIARGHYSDTSYYALYNGIYIFKTLLASGLVNNSNDIITENFDILSSQEFKDRAKELIDASYPYGTWRKFIIQSRQQDFNHFGSWVTESELKLLVEDVQKSGLLKDLDLSIILVDHCELESVFEKEDLSNVLVLVQELGYWLPLVYFRPDGAKNGFWFGAGIN